MLANVTESRLVFDVMLPDVSNEVVYDKATIDELLSREKDGRPLMKRLFEIYLEETPRLLEELEAGFAAGSKEVVYDVLHQMKGSAAALGARKLFRITEAALALCRDGEVLKCQNLVARIEEESDAYIRDLSGILNNH